MATRNDDDDDEELLATEVGARPLRLSKGDGAKGDGRSPDAIFRSFVANAYEEATPSSPPRTDFEVTRAVARIPEPSINASLRGLDGWGDDGWSSSIEELLDDERTDERTDAREPVTIEGGYPDAAPLMGGAALAPEEPEERRDTEPPPPDSRPTPSEPIRRDSIPRPSSPPPAAAPVKAVKTFAVPDEGTLRVVLLTKKKVGQDAPLDDDAIDRGAVRIPEEPRGPSTSPEWKSVVPAPSQSTQRREALKLVPDVAHIPEPEKPPAEGSEDGMMPGGELDRTLSDMAVLIRYGHEGQARRELDGLIADYPRDLLLLRRISEFWVAHHKHEAACDVLFTLASGLFERRNVEGMRQALEQVLVLSPNNERANRLIALLVERPKNAPS